MSPRLQAILALPSITHNLAQGSAPWDQFRLHHRGASEAAAALGLSKKVKRTELLHMKHTGLAREFSDWLQMNVLDKGHHVEALARPHIEKTIGDDLYPVTRSRGHLSASCDGLTMDDRRAFEHKQWAEELAAQVRAGILPDEHAPQCQQILLVTGAEELHFVVSDGTPDKMERLVVLPDQEWWERIVAGWAQFDEDLGAYTPPAAAPLLVAAPVQALPSVAVQVAGEIAIRHNFDAFEVALRDFLEHRLIRHPQSDQDFADLDVQIKAMKGAEAALESAEQNWIAQIEAVGNAKRTKDMLQKLVRDNRLMAEKLMANEKERRRSDIVAAGVKAFEDHIAALNTRLGRPYMPHIPADFAGCIKGMKSLASMEDKVATELARAKIAANEVADKIEINLRTLRELAADYRTLFNDAAALVLKQPDDCRAVVVARIAEHKAAEQKRADDLAEQARERIRKEEADRLAREQREREAAERREREQLEAAARQAAEAEKAAQPPAGSPIAAPAVSSPAAAPASPAPNVVPMQRQAAAPVAAPKSPPTVSITALNEALGLNVTASLLEKVGFPAASIQGKAGKFYSPTDLPAISRALASHLNQRAEFFEQQKAA